MFVLEDAVQLVEAAVVALRAFDRNPNVHM
jgi:hypothetical protein